MIYSILTISLFFFHHPPTPNTVWLLTIQVSTLHIIQTFSSHHPKSYLFPKTSLKATFSMNPLTPNFPSLSIVSCKFAFIFDYLLFIRRVSKSFLHILYMLVMFLQLDCMLLESKNIIYYLLHKAQWKSMVILLNDLICTYLLFLVQTIVSIHLLGLRYIF